MAHLHYIAGISRRENSLHFVQKSSEICFQKI